ncbi:hypothetical protein OG625_39050 [Streptomyces sp. NBC_01351]|uniref:hypothetical protein n=1 Tax=Streptomyces sp. NBC_01351 TaxID=2903833 RepID=UPI002E319523|nr:hypothetical protein [Streptomyces sp. NBC_01351]
MVDEGPDPGQQGLAAGLGWQSAGAAGLHSEIGGAQIEANGAEAGQLGGVGALGMGAQPGQVRGEQRARGGAGGEPGAEEPVGVVLGQRQGAPGHPKQGDPGEPALVEELAVQWV